MDQGPGRTAPQADAGAPSGADVSHEPPGVRFRVRLLSWTLAILAPMGLTLLFLVAYASLNHVEPDVARARSFHVLVVGLAAVDLVASLALARRDRRLLWAVLAGLGIAAVLVLKARQYTHDSCDFLGCTPVGGAAPGIVLLSLVLLAFTIVLAFVLRGRWGTFVLNASALAVSTGFLVASGFFLATLDEEARRADALSTNESIPGASMALLLVAMGSAATLWRRRRAG